MNQEHQVLAKEVMLADTFIKRFFGLLNKKRLTGGQGLLLSPCNSVHTCFLFYEIDIVYLNRKNEVTKTVSRLKPFRCSADFSSYAVLELPGGAISEFDIQVGNKIIFPDKTAKLLK